VKPRQCPAGCGGTLVTIVTHGADDSEVKLEACSTCDKRWWHRDGEPADLRSLLEEIAVMRRAS